MEVFLKGSKKKKEELSCSEPELCEQFKKIWDIRNDHMISGLPESYVFFLKCCYKLNCKHPICASQIQRELTWFPGGPSISELPFPFPDPERPWGSSTCTSCTGFCCGHYSNKYVNTTDKESLKSIFMPPSVTLKKEFSKATKNTISDTARKVLLSNEDTQIWLDHLETILKN